MSNAPYHTLKTLRRYEEQGDAGLYDKERTPKVWPSQTPADVEESILAFIQEHPNWGPRRISNELKKIENGGIKVGETAVYGVLKRNDLNTRQKRLKWIDSLKPPKEKTAWELDKEASKNRHVHAPLPGYLMSQDGKLIGSIAGIGRFYVQLALIVPAVSAGPGYIQIKQLIRLLIFLSALPWIMSLWALNCSGLLRTTAKNMALLNPILGTIMVLHIFPWYQA